MQLIINGEKQVVENVRSVKELLLKLGYETDSVAVAQDGTFVARSKYADLLLKEGQELEILVPMQGG